MADGAPIPPPPENAGCGARLGHLWLTNKPLAIFLIFLLTALIAGIIFLIVWFAVIAPNKNKNDETATVAEASATYTLTPPADSTSSATPAPASTAPAADTSTSASTTTPAKAAHFMRLRHN